MSEKTMLFAEASAAAMGSKASAGSATAVGGGLSGAAAFFVGINWIGWISLAIAVLGLLINLYFSWQRDRREKEVHRMKMKELEGRCNVSK